MNPNWYQKSFRRNLVDMHIDDWNEEFLRDFDPQEYFDCLKSAHIQTPMIYVHSHVGLCNWDTKSGRTHRAFAGNNKIKQLMDLCHEAGMDVIAYYSLIYNNWAYDAHPDWRILDYEGRPARNNFFGASRYGVVCPNNAEYREFLKRQFAEIYETYTFEGIYLDMTFWPEVCCCASCRERFQKETGRSIPQTVDWNDPDWRCFQKARQEWIGEFASFCTQELKALNPQVAVIHQCSPLSSGWPQAVDEGVPNANDYVGGDFYGGHAQESYICKLYREITRNQPFEYQTSRCDPNLNVHTITKTTEDMKLHNALTLAHHGALMFIDAINPSGKLNPLVYRRMGEVFTESIPYEKYLTGDLCSEAALIMSFDSKFDILGKRGLHQPPDWSHPQLDAQLGMSAVCSRINLLYTVLPDNHLERLTGKRFACLTDASILDEQQIEQIADWVERGGALYLSGTTDIRLANRLLGLTQEGYSGEEHTYMAPTSAGAEIFGEEFTPEYPLACRRQQMLVRNPEGHTVLATMTLPYTDSADAGGRFASIHSNPPGVPTEWPAMITGSFGAGRVLWVSASIEANSAHAVQDVVLRAIQTLVQPQILHSDAPSCVEFTLFEDEDNRRYLLHAVNVQKQPPIPVSDYNVRLKLPHPIKAVRHLPDETEVLFGEEDGQIVLHPQELIRMDVWMLSY